MTRARAVLGSALFFLIAPVIVAGVVPWRISRWRMQAPFFDLGLVRWVGAGLTLLVLPVLIDTFARFALQGRGTPAPVLPTQHLVITGANRCVRNPIYIALVLIILGQGLLLGSTTLVIYGAFVWIACHVFVLAGLRGADAAEDIWSRVRGLLCDRARWLPRFRPSQAAGNAPS